MGIGKGRNESELLPGTLEMLVLKSLSRGSMHGYGIAQYLKSVSADVLEVGEGSLYPALQRLLLNGWAAAEWSTSDNNRRARYYTITSAGRKQLARELSAYTRMRNAIARVMETA